MNLLPAIQSTILFTLSLDANINQYPITIQQSYAGAPNYSALLALSPNGKGGFNKFNYEILDSVGNIIATIPSSYQPDPKALDWSLEHAKSALVYISQNGSKLALEEENYRFKGKVFIVNLGSSPVTVIDIPRKMVEDLVGGSLEMYRISVDDGEWTSDDKLMLNVAGYRRIANGQDERFLTKISCKISIDNKISIQKAPNN